MGSLLRRRWVLALLFVAPAVMLAQQVCPQPPALEKVTGRNIFTDPQEVDLGDAMGESVAREVAIIEDPRATAHLEDLGARLARYLPPNNLRFRFFLIDLSEANALSLAGGRIYVARKMVALTRNDDELAGVLAHEMGHIVTHQHAIEMTRALKQILGVTQVGDRADIYDKFQRLLENERRKPTHSGGEGEGDQYIADQVALFAMARAGFAPQAYVDLWDRFNATHGKTGTWISDFFGQTKPEQKRLRELLKSVSAMPADCARIAASSSAEFQTWQARVIASSTGTHAESLPGLLLRQKLSLPLRPDVNNLRFSPDGKYVLAQDEGGIHVLSRDPFQMLFFIEAPGADRASFSPDSKSVVFNTPSLRVEAWDIATQKQSSVHEIVLRNGCLQSELSPDGRYFACIDKEFTLQMLEVESGKELASKKNFFQIRSWVFWLLLYLEQEENVNLRLAYFAFSPDGRYFLAGTQFSHFAYDFAENHEAKLPSSIQNATRDEFAFVDSGRLLGLNSSNPGKSHLLSFPGGERLQDVGLAYGLNLEPTAHGKYVAVGPLKTGKRGFIDTATGRMNGIIKEDAGDIYDNTVVYEELDGRILLIEVPSAKVVAHAQLTEAHLGDSRTIAVSEDFNWLAASTTSRGAVWDIAHNSRLQYVRGFTAGWFADDDSFYADFPKHDKQERAVVELSKAGGNSPVFSIGELLASQTGPYVVVRTPSRDNPYQRKNWTYEVRDFRTKATLWTRHFPQEAPYLALTPDYRAVLMGWAVSSGAAHDEMKQFPDLKGSTEKEDMFFELVDLKTNSVLGKVVVKTNKYSVRIQSAQVDGDSLVLQVTGDRVLTYSMASGKELGHVFGHSPVTSNHGGAYAVSTSEEEVNVYGLADSQLRRTYKFPVSVAYKKFSPDGKKLFVLTRDQTAYVLDLTAGQGLEGAVQKAAKE
ncbi:MAG TPA: M48 family metalloprotease [Candidatus Dormibacteraeota bacterium]|nr:M48 family metalloprotease [Candidatus Dormibacteraeota bacterium]